ncbi:vWA domain-containing protein [Pseudodesulfovibrio tunisiensis]|uniref:vWA domain-containing protein n=1 Tax=Pseudodesulfovibrio tunisiensis TaxID=463192 RepID=UPI001FB2131E|nr:vWA domain-containing protein [Pseudodesulfovibrio tunisiensis]
MKHSRKLLLIALVSALVMAFALPASAGMKKVKKVDNFVFFIDQSGSMAMKHKDLGKKKIDLAVDTATRMAGAIPSLDYTSSMFLFAPFASGVQPMTFSQGALKQGIAGIDTDYDIFGRQTPMGNGLMDLDPVLASLSGKTALIIFTDGNSNYGADPIAQAGGPCTPSTAPTCASMWSATRTTRAAR